MVLLLGDYLSIVRIYFCTSERWKAVMLYSWSIGRGEVGKVQNPVEFLATFMPGTEKFHRTIGRPIRGPLRGVACIMPF